MDAPYLTGRDTDGSGQLQATQTTVDSGVTEDGSVTGLVLFPSKREAYVLPQPLGLVARIGVRGWCEPN